jgi:hypothetical protein
MGRTDRRLKLAVLTTNTYHIIHSFIRSFVHSLIHIITPILFYFILFHPIPCLRFFHVVSALKLFLRLPRGYPPVSSSNIFPYNLIFAMDSLEALMLILERMSFRVGSAVSHALPTSPDRSPRSR